MKATPTHHTTHRKPPSQTLKTYKIPDGFVLVIDTREQTPLCQGVKGLVSVFDTLRDGDYSIRGFESDFAIERKGISDLMSYVGRENKSKTIAKLRRLAEMDWAGLVIEAGYKDILLPQKYSQVAPESVRQFLASVRVRYGIHIFYHPDTNACTQWVLDTAIKWYRVRHEV
jgi:ERCC4-type nuclease